MKALYLLCIPLLIAGTADAQIHHVLSFNTGMFFPADPGHDFSTTFPYTVTDNSNGSVSQQTFSGALQGKFTSPMRMFGLNDEFGQRHDALDMGVGLFNSDGGDHGVYLQGGYRYVWSLGGMQVKPGIDFYYFISKNRLGSIDNHQKEIDLLGYTANEQYTVDEDDGTGDGTTVENTYDAARLDVNYARSILLADPKITLSTNPKAKVSFSLEVGWMFQVVQWCDLELRQASDNTSASYKVGSFPVEQNGSLNGLYASVRVGIAL